MSTPTSLDPGSVFARDFSIVRPLSEGGMDAVYVVRQLSTGASRALKLMHPQLVREPRQRARFEQEARVGAQIESEHVVSVLGSGVDEASGLPWLVMELLAGQDLAHVIAERGALPVDEVRDIFAQLTHVPPPPRKGPLGGGEGAHLAPTSGLPSRVTTRASGRCFDRPQWADAASHPVPVLPLPLPS